MTSPEINVGETAAARARELTDGLFEHLAELGLGTAEMRRLLAVRLDVRERPVGNLAVAALDCNPEALSIYRKQLLPLSGVPVVKLLIGDLPSGEEGEQRLRNFDLLLTTTTHHRELAKRYPAVADKLVPVVVAPTAETVARLARLTSALHLGVICESERFFAIVAGHLNSAGITAVPPARILFIADFARLREFLAGVDAVIVPPGFVLPQDRDQLSAMQEFTTRGGVLLPFDYRIERGSLLHLKERLQALRKGRRENE